MYLNPVWRLIFLVSLGISLIACSDSPKTISKNPVAVPTQFYAFSNQVPATPETMQPLAVTKNTMALMSQVQSVDAELNSGEYEIAQQHLAQLTPQLATNPTLKTNLVILKTKLALLSGHPKQAISWLKQLPVELSPNPAQQHYVMQLRAQALYRTNQIFLSAVTNIENHSSLALIWKELLSIDPATLQAQQAIYAQPVISGWIALAQIAQRDANHFSNLKHNLLLWRQNYAHHSAANLLLKLNYNTLTQVNNSAIAIILPLSGDYAALGQAVQAGILSAYYASFEQNKARLTFYDSNTDSMVNIYHRLQENGDRLILGPLTKKDTTALSQLAQKSVKIISLNYTNINSTDNQLQFGLSPTDEARQIAELAWRQGKSHAIIIAPKTIKGQEMAEAFITTWSAIGGHVVDQYHYANNDDFSQSISALLGVSKSKWRQHQVHAIVQLHIASTPYFRKDADMIFLIANASVAGKIGPFIKFYSGYYFSIFATSSIYEAISTPNNKDLNDMYFCDMPALIQNNFNDFLGDKRLYLLGRDAYLLAIQQPHLNTLPDFPLTGATGQLTVDSTYHIQRELLCAQFKNGHPTPLKL